MYRYYVFLLLIPVLSFSQSVSHEDINSLIAEKNYAKAELLARILVEKSSEDTKAIELLGDAFSYQEKWDNAITQYEKLVAFYPENANYHYKYGGALAMKAQSGSKLKALGLIGDIKQAFMEAVKLDATHIEAHWALVDMYVTLPGIFGGSNSRAMRYADVLLKLSEVDGHLAKGYVYEYDNEPKLAEYHYKKAVEIGGSITCFEKLSQLYESQNQPEKAIMTIEESQKKHNRNALHYQLGKVSADYNLQLEKGKRYLLTYIANYSVADGVPKEWAYYRLAQIYKHENNTNEALKYIHLALNLSPNFKQAIKEKELILSR